MCKVIAICNQKGGVSKYNGSVVKTKIRCFYNELIR